MGIARRGGPTVATGGEERTTTRTKRAKTMAATRKLGRLTAKSSALFVCDIQDKFRKVIHGMPEVIQTASRLVRAANVLDVPIFVTEQYPQRLGNTVPEISKDLGPAPVFDKTLFSMCTPELEKSFSENRVEQVLLCGIETPVCVYQTCLDLVERQGVEVHVCVDGVSSQRKGDRSVALQRLSQMPNVFLCTSEMAMFQLVGDSKHPQFKQISALAKE